MGVPDASPPTPAARGRAHGNPDQAPALALAPKPPKRLRLRQAAHPRRILRSIQEPKDLGREVGRAVPTCAPRVREGRTADETRAAGAKSCLPHMMPPKKHPV